MKTVYTLTREGWLNLAVERLHPMFTEAGATIPEKVRVSCGWPSVRALAHSKRRIGECWSPSVSADQTIEMFISPSLGKADQVLPVLVHELVHAAVGNEAGHRAPFSRLAAKLGLVKPWTATTASPELAKKLSTLMPEAYPHAAIDRTKQPKQGTRMVKVICPGCGYTIRTTNKWIEVGLPTCVCGEQMEEA